MTTITLDKARQDLEILVDQVSRSQKRVKIRGKKRCVYLISQEELDGIQETLELSAIPGMRESILEGMKTPLEDCVSLEEIAEEFGWNIP